MTQTAPGRVPPQSVEAEEQLLSACLLDGGIVLEKCIAGGIEPESFYVPANRVIYGKLVELHNQKKPIDLAVLSQELGPTLLNELGGLQYMMRITNAVPTTARASYFIDKVRELALLREVINVSTNTVEDCYNYSGPDEIPRLTHRLEQFVNRVRSMPMLAESRAKSICDFAITPEDDEATLLGDRYACRGHAGMIVGGSGVGKSTVAYQASILWALGFPFFGIQVTNKKGWLSSLHVQAEDEDGDIAEVRESVMHALNLTDEQKELVKQRVFIITEKVLRGQAFINDMATNAKMLNVDLVWINPLQAFMEGDIKDAEAMGKFCREGLNAANRDNRWAYILVHHTPKQGGNANTKDREWNEIMYEGAGSAELVNFCRFIQVLKASANEGDFNLYLAKRGKKAAVVAERESESGVPYVELITKIPIRHAKGKITLPGRKKESNLLFWEPREETEEEKQKKKGGAKKKKEEPSFTQTQVNMFLVDMLITHPDGTTTAEFVDTVAVRRDLLQAYGRDVTQKMLDYCVDNGFLRPLPGGFQLTAEGKNKADAYTKNRA